MDGKTMKILMIGNSFCYSYVEALWGMAAQISSEVKASRGVSIRVMP